MEDCRVSSINFMCADLDELTLAQVFLHLLTNDDLPTKALARIYSSGWHSISQAQRDAVPEIVEIVGWGGVAVLLPQKQRRAA